MRRVKLTRPDDWHVHLRDGDYLPATVRDVSRYFGRAIVMPNLVPPVSEVGQAREYRDQIVSLVPDNSSFSPLMTLYLTDATNEETVVQAILLHKLAHNPALAMSTADYVYLLASPFVIVVIVLPTLSAYSAVRPAMRSFNTNGVTPPTRPLLPPLYFPSGSISITSSSSLS